VQARGSKEQEEFIMCSQVQCQQCGKPTWAGCGQHIEQALANVPKSERCTCREDAAKQRKAAPAPRP
jgi:hypothetical protein